MAINKKLIHFKTQQNFNNEVANENILDTSIVFIQDSKEIHTHGTTYKSVNWSVLENPIVNNISLQSIALTHGDSDEISCRFSYDTQFPVNSDITLTYKVGDDENMYVTINKGFQSAIIIANNCDSDIKLVSISPMYDGKYNYVLNN